MKLGIQVFNDNTGNNNSIALYSLPGGKVTKAYYDGTKDKRLNYELAGKVVTADRDMLVSALDKIVQALEDEPKIVSSDGSFETSMINITSEPYLSDVTTDGYIYFRVTFQVELTVMNKEDK